MLVPFEIAGKRVRAVEVFGKSPRPFVVVVLSSEGEFSCIRIFPNGKSVACHDSAVSVLAEFHGGEVFWERVEQPEVGAPCAGEIAVFGEIGTFAVVDAFHELWDKAVEVCVTLAVGVCAHVDGHPVDGDEEVGSVVEIEAAEEVLGSLSAAGVLGDDDPRDGFEDLATA